jgi:hypothetical protein
MTYAQIQKSIAKYNSKFFSKTELSIVRTFQDLDNQLTDLLTSIYKKYDLPIIVNGVVDGNATMAFMRARVIPIEGGKITRLNALQNQVRDILGPGLIRKDKYLESMARVAYQNGYYQNLWAIESTTGINLDFRLLNERAITNAVTSPLSVLSNKTLGEVDKLKVDRAAAIAKINREIEMGLGRGDDLLKVAKRIDTVLGFRGADGKLLKGMISKRGTTYESMRIARTETMRAYALGMQDQFMEVRDQLEEEGVTPRLQWVSTLDNRTRADHADMDGELSDEEGQFTLPDGTVGIQHNFGDPAQDINCRCAQIQVIDGLTPIVRRTRGEGIIPNQDFGSWADKVGIDESLYGEQYFIN